jgi:hypothetical protein
MAAYNNKSDNYLEKRRSKLALTGPEKRVARMELYYPPRAGPCSTLQVAGRWR